MTELHHTWIEGNTEEKDKKVADLYPTHTYKQIGAKLGLSEGALACVLRRLFDTGALKRRGKGSKIL